MPNDPELRLTLTLGGGASLGAYEAGAVAALLTAVRALRTAGAPVRVDTISATSAGALVGLLAGRPLGHFAGFLSRDLRRSDFALGYESARVWLPGALERTGLPEASTAPALAEVDRRRDTAWGPPDRGGAGSSGLSPEARLRLARFAVHAAAVLVRGGSR